MEQSFSQLLNSLKQDESGHWSTIISQNWMQGRTTYGGLTAALCLEATLKNFSDLPPLRSAQFNFIGPVDGPITISTQEIRRGRSVSYISAEMSVNKRLVTHAVLCFGASRQSKLNQSFIAKHDVPNQANSAGFFPQGKAPIFTKNFQTKLAKGAPPISGSDQSDHFLWCRHKDKSAVDLSALIGLADMPPPAVLPMFTEMAPLSSMTWMINILQDQATTNDGWWLLRSTAEHAIDGYTSQNMQVWNTDNQLVMTSRQNIAIFY